MDEVVEALEKYQGLVPLVYDIERQELDEAKPNEYKYAVYLKREADIVIRHHKYKRCLAMAERCKDKIETQAQYDDHDDWLIINEYWERWRKRWLKIAEKFNEAK